MAHLHGKHRLGPFLGQCVTLLKELADAMLGWIVWAAVTVAVIWLALLFVFLCMTPWFVFQYLNS